MLLEVHAFNKPLQLYCNVVMFGSTVMFPAFISYTFTVTVLSFIQVSLTIITENYV